MLEGTDPNGDEVRFELEGLGARVVQHEFDHLDGVLIIDRTDDEHRKEALGKLRPQTDPEIVRLAVAATAPFGADVLERLAAAARDRLPPHASRRAARPRPQLAPPPAKETAERLGIPVVPARAPGAPGPAGRRGHRLRVRAADPARRCSPRRSG